MDGMKIQRQTDINNTVRAYMPVRHGGEVQLLFDDNDKTSDFL